MNRLPWTCLILMLACDGASAQEPSADEVGKQAAVLEAEIGKFKDTSPEAAEAMVKLVDLYHRDGRLFGLVRVGQQFVTSHPAERRLRSVLLKLIDGQEALSRNKELAASIRQFLTRYPDDAETPNLGMRLADALRQLEDRPRAAEASRAVWRRRGNEEQGRRYGVMAMQIYESQNNNEGFTQAAQLGEEMLEKLPDGEFARQVGWQAFQDYRRIGQWAKSSALGAKLLQRKLGSDAESQRQLLLLIADNYGNLGQHANAAQSLQQARALRDDQAVLSQLILRLYHAGAKPNDLEPLVKEYGRLYPERPDRYQGISYWAMSCIANGEKPKGVALITALLVRDPITNGNAAVYVRENGSEPDRLADSEQKLLQAIEQNKPGVHYLRYVLATELYRDRMKDNVKTKQTLRELIIKSPSDDGYTSGAVDWLLTNSTDDAEFRQHLALLLDSRQKHPHLTTLRDVVKNWLQNAKQNKDFVARVKLAQEELKKADTDPILTAFAAQQNSQFPPGEAIRAKLLQSPVFESLSDDAARTALKLQSEWFRHYAPGNKRSEQLRVYKQHAQRFPGEYAVAANWLEAATDYGKPEDAKPAAEHMLKFEPENNSSDVWRRLLLAAERDKNNPQLARAAWEWMKKSQQNYGRDANYAGNIGDILLKCGLESEAVEHWNTYLSANRQSPESRECAQRLLARIKEPAPRIAFIQELMKSDSEMHGRYTQWLAEEYLKVGDGKNFELTLQQARTRQLERPFHGADFDLLQVGQWLDTLRGQMGMKDEERIRLYTAIHNFGSQPAAAAAKLWLLETAPVDANAKMPRLLELQRATRIVGNEWYDWDRLAPFALNASGKKDYTSSVVIATGLLSNVPNVDETRKKGMRELVTQSLSRMGGVGLAIDDSSPLAPLMQAAMYYRLGDERLAFDTYLAQKKLFHENRNQLPPDLLMFVCERLMASGEEADHDYVEEVLRGWLVQFSENMQQDEPTKARMQLLLAKNFFKARRYDVARAEYNTVVNRYANSPTAVEAEFGIAETFLAQKIYDQAEQLLETLARRSEIDVVVRAEFLRGVLAFRRGDRDEARDIFRSVLERVPNVELANQALFNLAEVYGAEERYIDQLNLLRTVGRLGRSSKRLHVPGTPLSIVVHDSDLGISRGHNRIPVRVTTLPGGDAETIYLVSSGAGKGLFRADLETRLGQVAANDHVLQLTGQDVIKCDYPEAFKAEFKNVPLSDVEIRVAADAKFEVSSSKIEDVKQETFSEELERQRRNDREDQRVSQTRPANQIKPGNLIYLRVKDGDRDLTGDVDRVMVKLAADSGDQIQVPLVETGTHTGVFEGQAKTGDLPAGALASDTGIDHSPLMAIDRDVKSFWMSEPDGATPKWLAVDMKDLREVNRVKLTTPNAQKYAPVRGSLLGSQDGQFWFRLASQPEQAAVLPLAGDYGPMTRHVYFGNYTDYSQWEQVVALSKNASPAEKVVVENMKWQPAEGSAESAKAFTVIWRGKFTQPRAGAVRVGIQGNKTALLVDGQLELAVGPGGRTADLWLAAGTHDMAIFAASNNGQQPVEALLARASLTTEQVVLKPFRAADFEMNHPAAIKPEASKVAIDPASWEFQIPARELRYVRFACDEYLGEALAISNLEVTGDKSKEPFIPTKEDVLALAANDTLEIAGGDHVVATYTDDITLNDSAGSQLLIGKLQATYFNATVQAISYDFEKGPNGQVNNQVKFLKRIDPGERIVVSITDYDEDRSKERDTIPFSVQVNDGPAQEFIATETQPFTGVFTKEIDTASDAKPDRLTVKLGDRITIRYLDTHNTFPGHSVPREETVYVPEVTTALIRVLETRVIPPPPNSKALPRVTVLPKRDQATSGVAFEAPLTVEVIDPDAAKDSRSTALVTLTTTDGAHVEVECFISARHSDIIGDIADRQALEEGRFIGQVILQLGGKNSTAVVPLTTEMARDLVGKVRLGEEATGDSANANLVTRVLNLTGKDIVTAAYKDVRRAPNSEEDVKAQGRLISNGKLQVTDRDYDKDVTQLHVGERLYIKVVDADYDSSDTRDFAAVEIATQLGEKELVKLEETLGHSGVFTGSLQLKAVEKPTVGNLNTNDAVIESYFGDVITVKFQDTAASTESGMLEQTVEVPVVVGTDGLVAAFSKTFQDETLAVETRFRIAESYFELFKSHKQLLREQEKKIDLEAGRRVLREVMEDYPDPKYAPRIAYLLGQFAQELEQWDEAIKSYELILRQYSEHTLAPDAQYKLAQCYETAGDFDQALEAYVTLAATHPKSPLIPNVMIRISDYFYKTEKYEVAAQVGEKFLERFESHSNAPRMAFRVGQCYYKAEKYVIAGKAFDKFSEVFPKDALSADSFFWAGESYRMAQQARQAFISYNNCRWKHPDSEAAKYARGRLALPEMLQQFEAEANSVDEDK